MTTIHTTSVKLAQNSALRERSKAHAKEALAKFKYAGLPKTILSGIAEKGYWISDKKVIYACERYYKKTKSNARKSDYHIYQL